MGKDARGRAVWEWAADTARLVALTASQVLRKLDDSELSLEDSRKSAKPMSPGARGGGGGGFNPYDNKLPARGATRSAGVLRHAAPTVPRPGAGARGGTAPTGRSPTSGRARSSWWRRLFGRG